MRGLRRNPIPTPGRRKTPAPPRLSPAVLTVEGDVGIFTIARKLQSQNRTAWTHWRAKHRERQAWEASIKNALVLWLEARSRQSAARRGVLGELVRGEFPPAPEGRYRVEIVRVVPRANHVITDEEDNLAGATKPILDALVSLGMIFSDRSALCERPLPTQRVHKGTTETIIRVSPFWRARAFEEQHDGK